jgi:hypothetical protein
MTGDDETRWQAARQLLGQDRVSPPQTASSPIFAIVESLRAGSTPNPPRSRLGPLVFMIVEGSRCRSTPPPAGITYPEPRTLPAGSWRLIAGGVRAGRIRAFSEASLQPQRLRCSALMVGDEHTPAGLLPVTWQMAAMR